MSAHTRRLMGSLGLLLEADGSSIPSTAADYITVPRETEDQRRERLAAEAGHTLTTCPECGGRATRESVLVYRTGAGTLQQTLIRCWRPGTIAKPRCQVQTLSEEPVGADAFTALEQLLARPASEEETMSEKTKPCQDCGTTIKDSHGRKRCPECNRTFERERKRLAWLRTNAERKGLPVPEEAQRLRDARGGRPARPKPVQAQTPAPAQPVPAPVAALANDEPEVDFAELVRDVMGLSLNRRNLLRALLEEVAA